ncbi:hypothetical protein [Nonomuraea sp. SYSU D8015]|uniref:hypothetical protein n=1 Tax=Nonomuraea sp. SYSU D8015 TaxID=2593644 RepID=UPI0016600BD5|nr:hypothetical protein [Nonomuraea sp. SYSU D8015]
MEPTRMLAGREVLRVVWLPGSDLLLGTCHCGATHVAEGPIEVWEWLLAHPIGHTPQDVPDPAFLTGAGAAR